MSRRADLIPAQRRGLVLEFLQQRGAASIVELSDGLGMSPSTVRRDLQQLEADGHLQRTHGGAILPSARHSTFEPAAAIAAQASRAQKAAIGRAAAQLLASGDSVIFDSGSTVQAAAQMAVARRIALTAVTNDLGIATVLAASDAVRVVVPGGSIRSGSLTLVGEPGQGFIGDLHADVAFIGAHAISGALLSETSVEIAAMKRAMIAAARRVVLLVDSSKFRPRVFYKICDIGAVHDIVTDDGADPGVLARLRELGVAVTLVDASASRPS